tara:strand:+ start:1544 stop:2893 length:1350 start_codon:yes stop_codon:yes gene_type:complete
MKKLLTSLLVLTIHLQIQAQCETVTSESITNPGIYEVATLSESDGVRNGADYYGSTIYYPLNTDEDLASIIIVPGFVTLESSIAAWGPFLASHGIVTMTIGTNNIFEQPEARANALLDAMTSLKEEQNRLSSPLNSRLNTENIALGGWSMGAGGAQIGAKMDSSIKVVIALCPWLETGLISEEYLNHETPILFISAEYDAIANASLHATPQYELSSETTPKLIYEVANGGHTVANYPTSGNGEVGVIALSWLKKYLLNEYCYCPILLESPETASMYMTNINCENSNLNAQEIECTEGWSIISTYVNPINTNFSNFIAPVVNNLIIAKDYIGNAYLPEWDYNGIGNIEQGQAYLIKMINTMSLAVVGEQIIASENSISLSEGWNLIANFNTESTNSDLTFAALVETQNVVIIKDYIGNALLPQWDFNGLGDLQPGRGYQIKVTANCELQY